MDSSGARQIEMPPDVRALSTLADADYVDAFLVDVGPTGERTPEEWLRAILEGSPGWTRHVLRSAWLALGLRVLPRLSGRTVLGWHVRRSTPDHVLLGAGSNIGMPAELLLQRRADGLLFATFVRRGNAVARALWARVEPGHVRVVASILEQAARRAGRERGA